MLPVTEDFLASTGQFLAELSADGHRRQSKDGYPELEEKKSFIFKVLSQEEEKFNKTIDQGSEYPCRHGKRDEGRRKRPLWLEKMRLQLYDTYGFPLDLTKEILEEKGYAVDEDGFQAAMEEQRTKARNARETTNYMGADATVYDEIDPTVTSAFVGYGDHLEHDFQNLPF